MCLCVLWCCRPVPSACRASVRWSHRVSCHGVLRLWNSQVQTDLLWKLVGESASQRLPEWVQNMSKNYCTHLNSAHSPSKERLLTNKPIASPLIWTKADLKKQEPADMGFLESMLIPILGCEIPISDIWADIKHIHTYAVVRYLGHILFWL